MQWCHTLRMPRNPNKTGYSKGFPEGFETFSAITGPRTGGRTLHHFGEVLFMAFAAMLCGMRTCQGIHIWRRLKMDSKYVGSRAAWIRLPWIGSFGLALSWSQFAC